MLGMTALEIEEEVNERVENEEPTWPMALRDAILVFAATCLATLAVNAQTCNEWSELFEFNNLGVPFISGLLMGVFSLIRHYKVVIPEKP